MRQKHLKEQESLLLKQAQLMALFAELDPDPVLRFDNSGIILLANKASSDIFNNSYLNGINLSKLNPIFMDINFSNCIKESSLLVVSTRINEKYFQFNIHGFAELEIGQVYGRDITAIKDIEENLKKALAKAEESEKLKSDFLAQMSHEVRTPLNSIIGFSSFLRNEILHQDNSELTMASLVIENSSKRLYKTIDRVLNMSQLHTGKYEPQIEQINLLDLLQVVYQENKSVAEENRLIFELHNKTGESKVMVKADYYSVNQIFNNLIDNAIKYTSCGNVDITVYRNGKDVNVDISDTGIGIHPEYQKNIFKPFSQEETGYSRTYDGTGLGLTLVKNYADLNGIQILINSEKNKGSKFTLIFTV